MNVSFYMDADGGDLIAFTALLLCELKVALLEWRHNENPSTAVQVRLNGRETL